MNRTESIPISPHLSAERNRLLNTIAQIRQAGRVAPAHCWLTESSETKGDQTYTYARLVKQPPGKKPTSPSLGKPGSEKHQDWQKAILRRDAIAELEQQLRLTEALIDRQVVAAEWVSIASVQ